MNIASKILAGCLAVFCIAVTVPPAIGQLLDPAKPEDALRLQQKMNCSLTEGEVVVYWWQGGAYSRVPGERDRHLFNVQGMNIRQCSNHQDPQRGPGFRSVSREVLLYLHPETNEVLQAWANPWTGEEVEVLHVANDPVNMRAPMYALGPDGKPTRFRGIFMKGRVWTNGEAPLFYENPLAGDYQPYVGGTYHATEMLNNFAYEKDLLDPGIAKLTDHTISWVRISQWLPWMKMGDRSGMMIFNTVGKRVAGIDDLSEPLRSEIRDNYPTYLAPPPLDDARPNETSWTYFRKVVEARRATQSAAAQEN
jgi:hypothetical protein